jgi:hypothetical protein
MQRHAREEGAALILLIGITAALAILAATGVMALGNQQGATASDRTHKTSLDYAEAGLDFAVNAVKSKAFSRSASFVDTATVAADYSTKYPSAPPLTMRVYDDATTVDPVVGGVVYPTPAFDQNADDKVWVEVQVTYLGKTARLRQMVLQQLLPVAQAVLFSDQDIAAADTSDIYAVNPDGTPDTSGLPYQTDVTCRWDFTGNASTNLAAPGTTVQSLGVYVKGEGSDVGTQGSVSLPGITENGVKIGGEIIDPGPPVVRRPYVPLLSDYFNQAAQAALEAEARAGQGPLGQGFADPSGTAVSSASFTPANIMSVPGVTRVGSTYTFASALVVNGNLTLKTSGTGAFPSGTIFNFGSLYVNGSLTLNGSTTTSSTALYVSGNFTISGPTGLQSFGPAYVAGDVAWSGGSVGSPLQVATGPLYVGSTISVSGVYQDTLGPTWVVGHPATSDVAVAFSATASSTVSCPLLAGTEKITSSGPCSFGTVAVPMILYMVCDNDELYTNTCEWGSTGTFTGIMALMEASIVVSNGNGTTPNIVGALFCAFNVRLEDASSICYNQAVIDNLGVSDVTVTSRTTVPGTWQELSPN